MNEWVRYLIAFVVACHGITYLLFGFLGPSQMKEWKGESWILGPVLSASRIRAAVLVVHVIAGLAIIASGIAIAFAQQVPGLWRPLAVFGGVASIAAFAAFWDGRPKHIVQEGGIGLGLSVILLMAALALPGIFS
jgi:hypothetical protein